MIYNMEGIQNVLENFMEDSVAQSTFDFFLLGMDQQNEAFRDALPHKKILFRKRKFKVIIWPIWNYLFTVYNYHHMTMHQKFL